jgi:hypothetical protein
LKVPAASVGINVEAQALGFWDATKGFGNYDTGLSSYAQNVEVTPLTKPFFDKFFTKYGQVPTYNAGTYDAIYILAAAITRAGTLDSDAVVAALEKTDMPGTVAVRFTFTGVADAPLNNPHDVSYGPGASTGLANQWQDGQLVGVWPNGAYTTDPAWKEVNYPGIVKWKIPPVLVDKLKAEGGTAPPAPAAPPAGEQPAAPPAEQPAAAAVSFPAATYTNDTNGFSIQYPKDWVARPEILTSPILVAAFGVSGFVPGVVVSIYNETPAETADWIVTSFKATGNVNPKVLSDIKDETLADGTKAYTFKAGYLSATGYDIISYVLDADKAGKRIRVNVFTIDAFAPYDEKLGSEIAHTLTFK